ncbi:MAG: HD domain-containing protein [Clostridiales bacterium]|nr:HD domain-containing protein [Clostridiales bacterium]
MKDDKEFFEELFSWRDLEDFSRAMQVARTAHVGQLRDEGTPYIEHIEGVIKILKEELDIQIDSALSVAALHDVLEDSDRFTYEDLKKTFGTVIADGVLLLTKKDGQDMKTYMENIHKSDIKWLMIVKLADRLHNLRSIKLTGNPEKIIRKCKETRDYVLTYAHKYPIIKKKLLSELQELERKYG